MSCSRAIAASLWLLLLLGGCQRVATPGDGPAHAGTLAALPVGVPPVNPALAKRHATLTIWLAADYAGAPLFRDLDADFMRAYPGVTIRLLGVPWEAMPTKVKTAIIGGNPPDIAHYHPYALGAQGFAEPLDDLWARWGARRRFLPASLQDCTWDGHLYGVPLDINCTVLLFNKRMFRSAHLPFPGPGYTLTRWRHDLRLLTDPTLHRYGTGLASGGGNAYLFILANGGSLLQEDHGRIRVTFDDPRNVAAIRFLTRLGWKDQLGPLPSTKQKDYQDATTLFAMGKTATLYTGPWDFETIREDAPKLDYGVVRFPAGLDGVQRGSVQGGGGLFVPVGARNRALAFEWMKWALSPPFAYRLAHELGRYPVETAMYRDPLFHQDPRIAAFVAALPYARPYPLDAFPQAEQAFDDAVKACFYGADPAIVLAQAQKVAQLSIDASEAQ